MRPSKLVAALLVLTVSSAGCVSIGHITTRMPAPLALTVDHHPTVYIARTAPNALDARVWAAFDHRLRTLLADAGVTMVEEHDVADTPPVDGDLVARVDFAQSIEDTRSNECQNWMIGLALFTLYLSALACVNQDDTHYAHMPVDVRVFDAMAAPRHDATVDQELVTSFDTSQLHALVHDETRIDLEYLRGVWQSPPASGPDVDAFDRTYGERMAELLAARLIPDLERAEIREHPGSGDDEVLDLRATPGA